MSLSVLYDWLFKQFIDLVECLFLEIHIRSHFIEVERAPQIFTGSDFVMTRQLTIDKMHDDSLSMAIQG